MQKQTRRKSSSRTSPSSIMRVYCDGVRSVSSKHYSKKNQQCILQFWQILNFSA
jgi:hypothetical protein